MVLASPGVLEMDARPLVQFQLKGTFGLLRELTNEATDEEWTSRPHPGANLIGFTVWHGARIVDWAVNCVLREREELADRPEWQDLKVPGGVFGAGVSRAVADQVAADVSRRRVAQYVDALSEDTMSWLAAAAAGELDGNTDLKALHAHKPEYMAPQVWEEIIHLDGIPKWQFAVRPAGNHIRVHYGEVSSQLESIRAAGAAR
jgi:hypothetical protein